MKKPDLAKLAMLGVSAGLVVGGCHKQDKEGGNGNGAEEVAPDMASFYASLTPEGQRQFQELDSVHKMMAIEMTGQSCNHQNKCAGRGGCATATHACAGQNTCKGGGGAPVQDHNKAVEIQFFNQMKERQKTQTNLNNSR